jgi:hypothetical protein
MLSRTVDTCSKSNIKHGLRSSFIEISASTFIISYIHSLTIVILFCHVDIRVYNIFLQPALFFFKFV